MCNDIYYTIASEGRGAYSEKKSRFLSFALSVTSPEAVRKHLGEFKKTYYDARHVCYAYVLGPDRSVYRANDDGEPSGTAGKPILGQINSRELTDVLVIVVRYFGGIKLGTSGLTGAYRQAASEALEASGKLEKIVMDEVRVSFEYPFMNDVMRIVKEIDVHIVSQSYDMDCQMSLSVRKTQAEALRNRLLKVKSLSVL